MAAGGRDQRIGGSSNRHARGSDRWVDNMYGRLGTGLLPGVIMLCGGLAAWTGSLQQARAMGAEPENRAALLLQCPAGAPDPKALCTALTTALQDALGGAAPASSPARSRPAPRPQAAGASAWC